MDKHELKCWPEYFTAIQNGDKTFEIRKNDRDFKVGDVLHLREWDPKLEEYTGIWHDRRIVYMTDFPAGLRDGYVALGIA